jgi:3-methyladenine DNA glycosylase AlkD
MSAAKQPKSSGKSAQTGVTLNEALDWLRKTGTTANIDGHKRYGITVDKAFGVTVGQLKSYAKEIGTHPSLALDLWGSGWYEAQILACFVGDPSKVTLALMNRWAKDFDNWAVVDTACFALFDRAPDRWKAVPKWAAAKGEFQRRAAFALLWSMSVHDKAAPDEAFLDGLTLIAKGATDDRRYVKLAVDMALRAIGKRNAALRDAAIVTAQSLAASKDSTARWIGAHSLKELSSRTPKTRKP